MSRTKITGYVMLTIAILSIIVDALDGNGFNLSGHFDAIIAALGGAGLVFLRDGVQRVQDAVSKK